MRDHSANGQSAPHTTWTWPRWHMVFCYALALILVGCNEPSATPTPAAATLESQIVAPLPVVGSETSIPVEAHEVSVEVSPTLTITATPSGCPKSEGWVSYTVALSDTLSQLAAVSGVTVTALMEANCLSDDMIIEGQRLYLPSVPPSTATPTAEPTRCAVPTGWVVYVVLPGDTLSGLASFVGVGVEDIRQANCLPDDTIYAGRGLWLPRLSAGSALGIGELGANGVVVERPTQTVPRDCKPFECSPIRPEMIDLGPGSPGSGELCGNDEDISIVNSGIALGMGQPAIAGSKLVLGACNVPSAESVTFSVMMPGSEPIILPASSILMGGTPIWVAIWEAGCAEAGSTYTVSYVTDASPTPILRSVSLIKPTGLTGYSVSLGGNLYRVHLCYAAPPGKPVQLRLHSGVIGENDHCIGNSYRDGETLVFDSDPEGASDISGYSDLILPLPGEDQGDRCYGLQPITTEGSMLKVVIDLRTIDGND